MHGEDKEPEQIQDERFVRLMLAYIKAEVVQGNERFGEVERVEVYRRTDLVPGWKVHYDCENYNSVEDVSPEQLYGWMWENPDI